MQHIVSSLLHPSLRALFTILYTRPYTASRLCVFLPSRPCELSSSHVVHFKYSPQVIARICIGLLLSRRIAPKNTCLMYLLSRFVERGASLHHAISSQTLSKAVVVASTAANSSHRTFKADQCMNKHQQHQIDTVLDTYASGATFVLGAEVV